MPYKNAADAAKAQKQYRQRQKQRMQFMEAAIVDSQKRLQEAEKLLKEAGLNIIIEEHKT